MWGWALITLGLFDGECWKVSGEFGMDGFLSYVGKQSNLRSKSPSEIAEILRQASSLSRMPAVTGGNVSLKYFLVDCNY